MWFILLILQLYGQRMAQMLPGGSASLNRGPEALTHGYYINNISAGKELFKYIIGHELGHVTPLNSKLPTSQRRERNAETFYRFLFDEK